MYCPIDGVVHLVEDTKKPRIVVPRAIVSALVLSSVSATTFGIATTYCISDFDLVLLREAALHYPAHDIYLLILTRWRTLQGCMSHRNSNSLESVDLFMAWANSTET